MKQTIRIEVGIKTSGEHCRYDCDYCIGLSNCSLFQTNLEYHYEKGKYGRCKQCLDAEVVE